MNVQYITCVRFSMGLYVLCVCKCRWQFLSFSCVVKYFKGICYFTIKAIKFSIIFFTTFFFQKNNRAQTSVSIFFTFEHYYFFEKLKIMNKNSRKLNCFYVKVSYALKDRRHTEAVLFSLLYTKKIFT